MPTVGARSLSYLFAPHRASRFLRRRTKMMAMTPYEKKTLDEIEAAFLEVVAAPSSKTRKPAPKRRGWFSGLADKIAMKFVCCAPPQTLLDDDEICEILAKIEEPVKPTALPPRKDSLMRRNSASVMPASRTLEHVTTQDKSTVADEPARPHVSLATMQRVVVSLLALHKQVETRQTERAVLAVQMKWRRRQMTTKNPTPSPMPSIPASPMSKPAAESEPDLEPNSNEDQVTKDQAAEDQAAEVQATLVSPKRQRSRLRYRRGAKKTKFSFITPVATEEAAEAVDSLTELALTRKRLRSVDLESPSPRVDVERNVHVLFGEEEIDEDDDVLDLDMPSPVRGSALVMPFSIQRCASVPPPSTALRPRFVKSTTLLKTRAACTIQHAWRSMKARQERETRRRLQQYEAQRQSVMPTIRSQMMLLRKRLEEIKERNSCLALVPVAPESPVSTFDDDFDWL